MTDELLRRELRRALGDEGRLRQLGPVAAGVPEPSGGGGPATLPLLVVEEGARQLAAPPWLLPGVRAAQTLSRLAAGSPAARAALDRVIADAAMAVCWLDAGAGRAPAVVGGMTAGELLLVESAPDGSATVGLADLAAARRRPLDALDPTRPLGEIHLDATPVRRLGRLDDGRELRAFWLLTTAADCLGTMAAGLDLALAHARERTAFGRPIGAFQAVRHRLADVYLDVETVRAAVTEGGAAWAGGDGLVVALAAASHALDAVVRVAEAVVLVHGAMGFTREAPAQSLLRRAYGIQALAPRARDLRIELARS